MNSYTVVKKYITETHNPILLRSGDVVECIKKSDIDGEWPNWTFCRFGNNEGWIPSQIIETKKNEFIVNEEYSAAEFNLEIGEILICHKIVNGWIFGEKTSNPEVYAWAPINHLKPFEESSINLKDKLNLFNDLWSPKIIAQMNNNHFKLAKIQGNFTWHIHKETDEVFIVINGEMNIEFRDKIIHLKEGELYVVSKGVEHKPYAKEECSVLLVEPEETINTGDSSGKLTAPADSWI